MSKWINFLLDLVRQVQAARTERDPIAGKTTRRSEPPTETVERGVRVEYTPEIDGDADPGEIVWAWVPYEEDANRGKDRPVVVIGRAGTPQGQRLAGVALTSKNKGRHDHVPVGTGSWDPKRRDSWAKVDRLLLLDDDDVRREGAILDRNRFDDVVGNAAEYHDLVRT
ncbi:type II toxin-antitoxin system PemK/MazF family toxin [Ilumatobacter nonamiensis]|uniref:type II toxin-antitoxin system PemK/MazF family toxin n=1 Tax=Ilumatobacter nonamiensis TaxID=467093 RepID=UPI00034956C0|nr:type II toxin-antitoxin system PemK/MazF family toxin [Ilumatobacter nonamiensis]